MEKFELLNQKYALDGKLAFCQREDGFIYADVTANGAKAQILLYGAHLMSFVPAGEEEVLWMSPEANLLRGKPCVAVCPYVSLGLVRRHSTAICPSMALPG